MFNEFILFLEQRSQILSFVIMVSVMILLAALIPVLGYRRMQKQSIAEGIGEAEQPEYYPAKTASLKYP